MASKARRWLAKTALTCGLAAAVMATAFGSFSAGVASDTLVSPAALPAEAVATQRLIRRGGPFPYRKDGAAFANRERLLPLKRLGYYREYTVATPGARDRGARRIVCGGAQPTAPDACYYTDDHYASFRRIAN